MDILVDQRDEFLTARYVVFHTKFVQFVKNQNIVKLTSCFPPKLAMPKYSREVLILVDIDYS